MDELPPALESSYSRARHQLESLGRNLSSLVINKDAIVPQKLLHDVFVTVYPFTLSSVLSAV